MNNDVVTARLHFVFSGLGDALADESKKKCVGIVSFLSLSLLFFFFFPRFLLRLLSLRESALRKFPGFFYLFR